MPKKYYFDLSQIVGEEEIMHLRRTGGLLALRAIAWRFILKNGVYGEVTFRDDVASARLPEWLEYRLSRYLSAVVESWLSQE